MLRAWLRINVSSRLSGSAIGSGRRGDGSLRDPRRWVPFLDRTRRSRTLDSSRRLRSVKAKRMGKSGAIAGRNVVKEIMVTPFLERSGQAAAGKPTIVWRHRRVDDLGEVSGEAGPAPAFPSVIFPGEQFPSRWNRDRSGRFFFLPSPPE